MNEHDDLIARLRTLGEQPVEPVVASRHLTAMAAARRARPRFGRAKAAAAFAAGLVLGTTGLASAGVLPDPVQETVSKAAEKVGINGIPGKERQGGCEGYVAGQTHGQYVSSATSPEQKKARAKSDCGKPVKAANTPNSNGADNENRSECAPPWAGKGRAAKGIKAQNENWTPPAGCGEGVSGTGAEENEAGENEADDKGKPEATPAPQSQVTPAAPPSTTPAPAADQGQEKKEENAPTTTVEVQTEADGNPAEGTPGADKAVPAAP